MKITKILRVERRVWGTGNEYLAVPSIKVFPEGGFKEGDEVVVEVTRRAPALEHNNQDPKQGRK
jgi:hypothetical protein